MRRRVRLVCQPDKVGPGAINKRVDSARHDELPHPHRPRVPSRPTILRTPDELSTSVTGTRAHATRTPHVSGEVGLEQGNWRRRGTKAEWGEPQPTVKMQSLQNFAPSSAASTRARPLRGPDVCGCERREARDGVGGRGSVA